ncbi:MAG: selenium cofactor biosynthesis protein YqeC [Acidobacteriota bacterium]
MQLSIQAEFGLAEVLRIRPGEMVGLVGAGGKTTSLYGIASELHRRGLTVIATATTHLQTPRTSTTMPPLVVLAEEANWRHTVKSRIERYGCATVVGERIRKDKLRGLDPSQAEELSALPDCVVLEADGARGRSLKAPATHEPVLPEATTLTVILASLDALDMPLDTRIVHRLEVVTELTGATPGARITEDLVARTLAHGYLPRVPPRSRAVFFLNKAFDSRFEQAETTAKRLLLAGAREVIFGQAILPNDCFYRMTSGS